MSNHNPEYAILIHYSEIALKKNNRSFFERKFVENITKHLKNLQYSKVRRISSRIFIEGIEYDQWDEIKGRIKNVMGMKNAILMIRSNHNLDDMKNTIDILVDKYKYDTFRITCKRHFKGYEKTSQEINMLLGEHVVNKTKKSVNLTSPDLNIIIEILKDKAYIGSSKILGYSGLPAKSQEKAFSLISSGIDSPVASFEMIKRGVNLNFIHFHSAPAVNRQSIENVKKLINLLLKYQLECKLYIVPLLDVQQKIMQEVKDKFWVIFFRRSMIKIANKIALSNKGAALVTGDAVGQVASQTLSNIRAISEASTLPILRPLSGMNKEDIINRAREIGTYDISIEPYQDCCSFFVPAHPETKAKMFEIFKIDENLDLDNIHQKAIEDLEVINYKYRGE
tara:strand:+ start:441 stop:1625 length:1185 start_codon:yes stop_codon:yes gene_type:complete